MESSLQSLEPSKELIVFFTLIKFSWFFGNIAYDGLINGKTITPIGVKEGKLARLQGFLYLIGFLLFSFFTAFFIISLLDFSLSDYLSSFSYSFRFPSRGYIFVSISIISTTFREIFIYIMNKRNTNNRLYNFLVMRRKPANWGFSFFFAIGIRDLLGLPYILEVITWFVLFYLSPILSVKRIRSDVYT
jgi:hypothetical protein